MHSTLTMTKNQRMQMKRWCKIHQNQAADSYNSVQYWLVNNEPELAKSSQTAAWTYHWEAWWRLAKLLGIEPGTW